MKQPKHDDRNDPGHQREYLVHQPADDADQGAAAEQDDHENVERAHRRGWLANSSGQCEPDVEHSLPARNGGESAIIVYHNGTWMGGIARQGSKLCLFT